MANVLNRTTKEYRTSVNTPDFDPGTWIINPDLSAVTGFAPIYWTITGDVVTLQSPAERAATDAAIAAAQETAARDDAKTQFDATLDPVSKQTRAILNAFIDEFNRHSDVAYGSIVVNNQAAAQSIPAGTPTIVNAFAGGTGGNGEDFGGATADAANNRITLGAAGKYFVGLSASYAHTGGSEADMTWSIAGGGTIVPALQARRKSSSGDAASLSIGPIIQNVATDNVVVDVRVEHNETGPRNLIVAHASLFAMRVPSIPQRSFADLRTVVRNAIDSE